MIREEQIDIRRRRAKEGHFTIQNLGRNRVFSDYQVRNPDSGGQYTIQIRGFEVGDNACTCPDFRSNTLGTCKHIEAVLESLQTEAPATVRQRKATVTRPEVYLHYGEQLRIGLHLPPRHSDPLRDLSKKFSDSKGFWNELQGYDELITAVRANPEHVTVFEDAMEFIDRELDRRHMDALEGVLLTEIAT